MNNFVLIPTEKETQVIFNIDNRLIYSDNPKVLRAHYDNWSDTKNAYQNLYELSDEEFKEGDHVYKDGRVFKVDGFQDDGLFITSGKLAIGKYFCKKIISTTDDSLIKEIRMLCKNCKGSGNECWHIRCKTCNGTGTRIIIENIPLISKETVEKFVKEYNNGHKHY